MTTQTHSQRATTVTTVITAEEAGAMAATLAELSTWIDNAPANAARSPEAATWGRLAKVAEECGEVVAAYIGATGQNPRKGTTHGMADVCGELLDVAVTALSGVEHLTGNQGHSINYLTGHLDALRDRMHRSVADESAAVREAA